MTEQERLDTITELRQLAYQNRWYRVTADHAITALESLAARPTVVRTCGTCLHMRPGSDGWGWCAIHEQTWPVAGFCHQFAPKEPQR